ncbi:MAG: Hpt domain-containing protein, partial [Myxococcota bacterium]|nr:Hpt domain-containing protein [Myxococcota bacterium]
MDHEALKKSLLKKFQEVTADRLTKIQLGAIDLEKPTAAQAAEEVARELHTMKGEARMLGLPAVGQIAHAAEDLLKASREGKTTASAATDLLLRACDAVSDLIEDLPGAQTGNEISESICKALSEASGHPVPPLTPGHSAAAALKRSSASGAAAKVPEPPPRPPPPGPSHPPQ